MMRAEMVYAWVLEAFATLIRRSDGTLPELPMVAFGVALALGGLFIGYAMAWQGLWRLAGLVGIAPRDANTGTQVGSALAALVAVVVGGSFGTAGAMALWGFVKTIHLA